MRHWHIYLTIIAVLCGTLFAWVFLAQAKYQAQTGQARKRNLAQTIRSLETETRNLENEIMDLRRRLDAVQQKQGEKEAELSGLARELAQAKMQAGLVEVEGPGIVITLDDDRQGALRAQANRPGQYRPEDFIIHDKNLLYLVNELRQAGAEAISINNQRLVATSDIRCVGTAILVNATRLVPPYEIKAIGNVQALTAAVTSGQEYPFLKGKGFPVSFAVQQKLTIPAFRGTLATVHLVGAGS